MSSPEFMIHNRYRAIYAVDERPGHKVYRCRDEQSGKLVLIAQLAFSDDAAREDLELLAAQIATVKHDMLLPLNEHFAEGQAYYLVCDDPGGQDLERALRMRGTPFEEKEVISQALRLLGAVEHLHSQRPALYLGDPTPTDVWISENGNWSLTPFTLARPIGLHPSPYRAPELSSPSAEPVPPSDLYAVGTLLYQMLTGWPPPLAEQQKAGTKLNPPRTLNPSISTLTEQALLRSLQLRQVDRYQVAREMRLALDMIHITAERTLTTLIDAQRAPQPPAAHAPVQQPPPPVQAQPTPGTYPPAQPGQPVPGYAIPQGYPPAAPGQQYPAGYPPQAAPQKRGPGVGCMVGVAVVLILLAVGICITAVLFFQPLRQMLGIGGMLPVATSAPAATSGVSSAATPEAGDTSATTTPALEPTPEVAISALPTLEPIELGQDAITLQNVTTITQTREITTSILGPVGYSPDGTLLAIGISNIVNINNAETIDEVAVLDGHTGRVTSLAWSADGTLVATGASGDNRILVWDPQTGDLKQTLTGHSGWIRSLAFSPDGAILASGSTDLTINLWDAESGTLLHTLQGHTGLIGGVVFSPDGASLASASRDGTVRLWDVATGQPKNDFSFQTAMNQGGSPQWTTGIAFSPDGQTIAVGAIDGVVYLLEANTGKLIRQLIGHTDWVVIRGIVFSPDGSQLITSGLDATIRIWDPNTGVEIAQLLGHQLDIFSIALSPDNKHLVSSSDEEGFLLIWDLERDQVENELRVGQGIMTTAFSQDSRLLALAGFNGRLRLQQLSDSDTTPPFDGSASLLQPLAFLPDDSFASVTDQGTVVIVNLREGQGRELTGLNGRAISVAASRDGKLLAAGDINGTVVVWESINGRIKGTFNTQLSRIPMLSFSGDGKLLAAAGSPSEPNIEIWDIGQKKLLYNLDGPAGLITGLSFQPGGTLLAATSIDGTLRLWDAQSGLAVRSVNAAPDQGWFTAVTFSPDGTMLVTGAYNGDVQLWNVGSGEAAATYKLPDRVWTIGFSPDGNWLAISLRDGSVRIFTLP